MQNAGLKPTQIAQVRGFADQNLLYPKDPANPSNRRVSVIVQYSSSAVPLPPTTEKNAKGKPAETPAAAEHSGHEAAASPTHKPK